MGLEPLHAGMTDGPRRTPSHNGSAALESRIARLEQNYDRLEGKVTGVAVDMELVKAEQRHLSSLVTTQHESVKAELGLVRERIHGLVNEIHRAFAEPEATAMGRALLADMTTFRLQIAEIVKESRENRRVITLATGALSVVIILVNLLTPVVLRSIGAER